MNLFDSKIDQPLYLYIAVDRFLNRTVLLDRFLNHALTLDRFLFGRIDFLYTAPKKSVPLHQPALRSSHWGCNPLKFTSRLCFNSELIWKVCSGNRNWLEGFATLQQSESLRVPLIRAVLILARRRRAGGGSRADWRKTLPPYRSPSCRWWSLPLGTLRRRCRCRRRRR